MDSITQGLLGAAIADAGFTRRLGGRAVAWGAFCGVAPDFDLAAMLAGEWNELVHHRGISHSLLALGAATPLLGALAWRFLGRRQGRVIDWIHLTFWALVTHPLLDTCTSYGTQLLAPVSSERFAIDAIAIVDPFYSLPLFVAVVVARVWRDRTRSARLAAGALVLTTAYLGVGFAQSQRAVAWAEEELAQQGFPAVETRAMPTLFNVLVFRIVARDGEGGFRLAMLSLSAPRPLRFRELRDDADPLVAAAQASERGRLFRWFAMDMACSRLVREDDGFVVRMSDLRYGSVRDPTAAMWGADARFDLRGELVDVSRWHRRGEFDAGAEIATLWALVTGAEDE